MSVFVVLALTAMLRIRAIATPSWAAERQASADFFGFLSEYLAGLEDIRSSAAGAFVLRRCAEVMRSWLAVTRKAQMRGYALVATSQGLFALGTIVVISLYLLANVAYLVTLPFSAVQHAPADRVATATLNVIAINATNAAQHDPYTFSIVFHDDKFVAAASVAGAAAGRGLGISVSATAGRSATMLRTQLRSPRFHK
jgi:ABC-type multidrug transport system fused ATPase/permease subunit